MRLLQLFLDWLPRLLDLTVVDFLNVYIYVYIFNIDVNLKRTVLTIDDKLILTPQNLFLKSNNSLLLKDVRRCECVLVRIIEDLDPKFFVSLKFFW